MTPREFAITISDTGDDINIALAGELDLLTITHLRVALDAAIDQPRHVVVDLADVTFIDSTVMYAVIQARDTLAASGRRMRLENPAPIVARAFTLTGLGHHFDSLTGPVEPAPAPSYVRSADGDLEAVLHELARQLLTERSLRADLERLITFTCNTIPHCTAASIALLIDGQPSTVATTEHLALELDIAQYRNDEGPCLAALDGQPIRVDILDTDERFTHFAHGVADHHINSVLSMPINHHDHIVGTLNLYAHTADAFTDDDTNIAYVAATQAAHAIVRSDLAANAHQLRDRLQADYDEAILTARAQGILIALHHCSTEQAHHLLTNAATATNSTLTATARRVLHAARGSVDHTD